MNSVSIVDVAPRDGLQSEQKTLPTATKVRLIEKLYAAGITQVEVTSFVNPKRVPQMADATELLAALAPLELPINKIGLALNLRGCERAIEAGVDEVGFVLVSTDTFSQRNQGAPVSRSIEIWQAIAQRCRAAGVRCNVLIAAAFGCPFEGEVSSQRVLDLAEQLLQTPPDCFGVADSIGVGVPSQIKTVIGGLTELVGELPIRCHLHDTRNTGIANALAAIEAGASMIDASTGGIGGCPFAPAATGNIATEDLLYALDRSGVSTGVDIQAILSAGQWLAEQLGHPMPSALSRAGIFPPQAA